tara:strand:+ start:1093 stop:2208 length:1116 start_codon:yes stop_codon:yes gene_type:complete
MNICVLTSSRADYGIYRPLLRALESDPFFNLKILAFGTHLSDFYGKTIENIYNDGYTNIDKIETLVDGDSALDITVSMSLTMERFGIYWNKQKNHIDLIIVLGDRFEMFAAVASAVPFNLAIAHLYGGETTLGAIDDKFRHMITSASVLHFTSTEEYKQRVINITGKSTEVYNIGTISIDNLLAEPIYSLSDFKDTFGIDLSKPSILITLHPETVKADMNEQFANEFASALIELTEYQLVITMPNADTNGRVIREIFQKLKSERSNVVLVENFGTKGYFSCINHCSFLMGNTSSGLVEAASFNKYVINLGERQLGRIQSENTFNCPFDKSEILKKVTYIESLDPFTGENEYKMSTSNSSDMIINVLKEIKL